MNMIFIYVIIFIISIDNIITTNILKNSSTNRVIIIASCQADKTGLESIPISSDRHSYFYFSSQSSLSLSSSSSFLPLLHLSYCEHQHTTYYSSSGFSILRSSPRLPLTDILNKNYSSSFQNDNAILPAVDQSSSTSGNMITTLMSSTTSPSSNEKHVSGDDDDNPISTTISSLTTTTTTFSNISLFHTSLSTATQKGNQTFNIMLLTGCLTAGIIILIIIYIIIKYCNRDEGSYKIDESKTYSTKSHLDKPNNSGCTGKISSSKQHHHQKLLTTNEQNIPNSKEWYV